MRGGASISSASGSSPLQTPLTLKYRDVVCVCGGGGRCGCLCERCGSVCGGGRQEGKGRRERGGGK